VRLKPLLDRRPIVVALAGPNGAGKSTFYDAHLATTGLHFVNADVLALNGKMSPYVAANAADVTRRHLVEQRESFIFETVFSDPVGDKLKLLKDAEHAGYTVVLVFIGIAGPEISDDRVAMRVSQGGHDVPQNKLVERFPRVMNNLKRALTELSNVWVFDNSDLVRKYQLVAKVADGQEIELYKPTPDWLKTLLPRNGGRHRAH
jgi:predicted ABC-type ATPase